MIRQKRYITSLKRRGNLIKAIIFDLDGTLLDTIEDIKRVANIILAAHGFPCRTRYEIRMAVGSGVEELVRRIVPKDKRNDDVVATVTEEIKKEYLKGGIVLTKPYDGIPELLSYLSLRKIPMMVLTNKPQASAEKAVSHFFPEIPFEGVLGFRSGLPRKPDLRIVAEALELLGSSPDSTTIIGDSDIDMQSGTISGLYRIGVSWGYRDVSVLRESGADIIVDSPSEIIRLV